LARGFARFVPFLGASTVGKEQAVDIKWFFAGVAVADYPSARAWYERLIGRPADFNPHENEAAWQILVGRLPSLSAFYQCSASCVEAPTTHYVLRTIEWRYPHQVTH
jgi:hypothetical protein